jgi:hypothetical protein
MNNADLPKNQILETMKGAILERLLRRNTPGRNRR